jgi:hypothetical protein
MSLRTTLLLLVTASLPLAACGGGSGGQPTPEGTKYPLVVSSITVPATAAQATKDYGLDIDGDGKADNQLGQVLATLKTQNIDVQSSVTTAVDDGTIVLLAEFQAKDFTSTSAAGMAIYLGDKNMITPKPCDTATPPVCRKHLTGAGAFVVSAGSPKDALVSGPIVGGTFKGGPGKVSLQIALTQGQPALQLDLLGARASASGISADGITKGILAGAISKADLDGKVIPAIKDQLNSLITTTCTAQPKTPPGCGCPANSTGAKVLTLFEAAPNDCVISKEEITSNSIIKSLLSADVNVDGVEALSLGIGFSAVKGSFTP